MAPACVRVETTVATRAQIAALESVYRWQSAARSEAEFRIDLKTTVARHEALPRLLVLEITNTDAAYARWVAASLTAPLAA